MLTDACKEFVWRNCYMQFLSTHEAIRVELLVSILFFFCFWFWSASQFCWVCVNSSKKSLLCTFLFFLFLSNIWVFLGSHAFLREEFVMPFFAFISTSVLLGTHESSREEEEDDQACVQNRSSRLWWQSCSHFSQKRWSGKLLHCHLLLHFCLRLFAGVNLSCFWALILGFVEFFWYC